MTVASAPAAALGTNLDDTPRTAELLLHPLILAAIALMLLNDHVLKQHFGGWVTGKLSDVAGLSYFPVWLYALCICLMPNRWLSPQRRIRVLWLGTVATALAFIAIKTMAAATEVYCVALAALQWPIRAVFEWISTATLPPLIPVSAVTDPTDLLALPFVIVGIVLARRAHRRS